MDENTNQPSTTPLGNERSLTPGQDNIASNNLPALPNIDENTPLSDITKQYTDIGAAYTDLVENAADNVGDRQVQLVGNDFGATNPYMFNTYYEPAATSFASEMRQQGTQRALEVGLDRAAEEAKKNAEAAQNRYNNALAAAKKKEEELKNSKVHVSETDISKLPQGTNEQDLLNSVEFSKMSEAEQKDALYRARQQDLQLMMGDRGVTDWNIKPQRTQSTDETFKEFGVTREEYNKWSQKQKDAFWSRLDVGNFWTERYMIHDFERRSKNLGWSMEDTFTDIKNDVNRVIDALRKNDISSLNVDDFRSTFSMLDAATPAEHTKEGIMKSIERSERLSQQEKDDYRAMLQSAMGDRMIQLYHGFANKSMQMNEQGNIVMTEKGGVVEPSSKTITVNGRTYNFGETAKKLFESFAGNVENIENMSVAPHVGIIEYSGSEVYTPGEGMTMEQNADRLFSDAFNVDFTSIEKIMKLKEENPDDYEYLMNQASYILTSGGEPFGVVEDKDKKYFINGKWWAASDENSPISVGDLVLYTVDGTVQPDGSFQDPHLEKFVDLYTDIRQGKKDASDENLKLLNDYYSKYQIATMAGMAASSKYGMQVDSNVYAVVLSNFDDVDESDLVIFDPSKPESGDTIKLSEMKEWFESFTEDERYNGYTAIADRARRVRGYYYVYGGENYSQLQVVPTEQNGEKTIGKKGKKITDANMKMARQVGRMTDEQCLALNMYLDMKMKKGEISTDFFDNDEVQELDIIGTSMFQNITGLFELAGVAGTAFLGAVTLNEGMMKDADRRYKDMTTLNEKDNHNPFSADGDRSMFNEYTIAVRQQQRANLNHLVDTTFNIEYFNPSNTIDPETGEVKDKDGNVIKYSDNTYFHRDDAKAGWDMAAGIGGFVIEAFAEMVLAKSATKAISKLKGVALSTSAGSKVSAGVNAAKQNLARVLTTEASASALKSTFKTMKAAKELNKVRKAMGDGVFITTLMSCVDDELGAALKTAATKAAISSFADEPAKAAINMAQNSDDFIKLGEKATAARSEIIGFANGTIAAEDLSDNAVDVLLKVAGGGADNIDDALRIAGQLEQSGAASALREHAAITNMLDNVAMNADDVAAAAGQKLGQYIRSYLDEYSPFKGLVNRLSSQIDDVATDSLRRAAINTRLAEATGILPQRIANLSDDTVNFLYSILTHGKASDAGSIFGYFAEKNMVKATADIADGVIDFKKAATAIIEAAESVGGNLGVDDMLRILAKNSDTKGALIKAMRSDAFWADRLRDWGRDIAQGYYAPTLNQNFESDYTTFDEYITDPNQLLGGVVFDLGITGLSKTANWISLKYLNGKINHLINNPELVRGVANDSATTMKNLRKLNELSLKADRLSDKIFDGSLSFNQVHDTVTKASGAIDTTLRKMTDDFNLAKSLDLMSQNMDEAVKNSTAWDNFKGKTGFGMTRQMSAQQLNRALARSDKRLNNFIYSYNALKSKAILRTAEILNSTPNMAKFEGRHYAQALSECWHDEIMKSDFAKMFGEENFLKKKDGTFSFTINTADKDKAKEAFQKGQEFLWDSFYNHFEKNMRATSDGTVNWKAMKTEFNSMRDIFIQHGFEMIDAGERVRWNYFPLEGIMWQNPDDTPLALWGFFYGSGSEHTTLASNIPNPLEERDTMDMRQVTRDILDGKTEYTRKLSAKEEARMKRDGIALDSKNIKYNMDGFNPAYAAIAYSNAYDSRRFANDYINPIKQGGVAIASDDVLDAARKADASKKMEAVEDYRAQVTKRYEKTANENISNEQVAKNISAAKSRLEKEYKKRVGIDILNLQTDTSVKIISSDQFQGIKKYLGGDNISDAEVAKIWSQKLDTVRRDINLARTGNDKSAFSATYQNPEAVQYRALIKKMAEGTYKDGGLSIDPNSFVLINGEKLNSLAFSRDAYGAVSTLVATEQALGWKKGQLKQFRETSNVGNNYKTAYQKVFGAKIVDTGERTFKSNHPSGGESWFRNVKKNGETRYELAVPAMLYAFDKKTWTNPKRSAKIDVDFNSLDEMVTFGILHERAHDILGKYDGPNTVKDAKAFETSVNKKAEELFNAGGKDFNEAKAASKKMLEQLEPKIKDLGYDITGKKIGKRRVYEISMDELLKVRDPKDDLTRREMSSSIYKIINDKYGTPDAKTGAKTLPSAYREVLNEIVYNGIDDVLATKSDMDGVTLAEVIQKINEKLPSKKDLDPSGNATEYSKALTKTKSYKNYGGDVDKIKQDIVQVISRADSGLEELSDAERNTLAQMFYLWDDASENRFRSTNKAGNEFSTDTEIKGGEDAGKSYADVLTGDAEYSQDLQEQFMDAEGNRYTGDQADEIERVKKLRENKQLIRTRTDRELIMKWAGKDLPDIQTSAKRTAAPTRVDTTVTSAAKVINDGFDILSRFDGTSVNKSSNFSWNSFNDYKKDYRELVDSLNEKIKAKNEKTGKNIALFETNFTTPLFQASDADYLRVQNAFDRGDSSFDIGGKTYNRAEVERMLKIGQDGRGAANVIMSPDAVAAKAKGLRLTKAQKAQLEKMYGSYALLKQNLDNFTSFDNRYVPDKEKPSIVSQLITMMSDKEGGEKLLNISDNLIAPEKTRAFLHNANTIEVPKAINKLVDNIEISVDYGQGASLNAGTTSIVFKLTSVDGDEFVYNGKDELLNNVVDDIVRPNLKKELSPDDRDTLIRLLDKQIDQNIDDADLKLPDQRTISEQRETMSNEDWFSGGGATSGPDVEDYAIDKEAIRLEEEGIKRARERHILPQEKRGKVKRPQSENGIATVATPDLDSPMMDFIANTTGANMTKSSIEIEDMLYGKDGKDGYFDKMKKLNKDRDNNIAVANGILSEDVAESVAYAAMHGDMDKEALSKMLVDVSENLDIDDPILKKEIADTLIEQSKLLDGPLSTASYLAGFDPTYNAMKRSIKEDLDTKRQDGQIMAHISQSGDSPVIVNSDADMPGRISVADLRKMRETVVMEKNGSGPVKGVKNMHRDKKILSNMRDSFNDGYTKKQLVSEASASQQDKWIDNLMDEIRKTTGVKDLDESKVYIDRNLASLGQTYFGEGRNGWQERAYKLMTSMSNFNKEMQSFHLAGGVGQYNAFTLRNAITMMWQDPIGGTRALFTNFRNAKDNTSVRNFLLNNSDKMLKYALDSGDFSSINAFANVVDMRDPAVGGGVFTNTINAIMDTPRKIAEAESKRAGFGKAMGDIYKEMFDNPTFARWTVIAKADMQMRNYDRAQRYVTRLIKRYGLTDEDFATMEGGMGSKDKYIATLARLRTDMYWQPQDFVKSGLNAKKYLDTQEALNRKRTVESLRGISRKTTAGDAFRDFFFAINYKLQMNAHPIAGMGSLVSSVINVPRAGAQLSSRTSFNLASSRFAGGGNRSQATIMLGIAALAHAWNTYIGAPSAWEQLWEDDNRGDEKENALHGIAQSLMNLQDFGKFWLPNGEDGKFNRNETATAIDPFFSIFTLQNSGARALNKALYPNQNPVNWQRSFGAGPIQIMNGTPAISANENDGSLGARIGGVADELIGANLLAGYKAIYEVMTNSTYFGNNIWERKFLPDGSENPNYNPYRNLAASVAHIFNLDAWLEGKSIFDKGSNRWVKGLTIDSVRWKNGEKLDIPETKGLKIGEAGVYQDRTGTVSGSGLIQHEYTTALQHLDDGDYFGALTEAMELPFKTRSYAARAKTALNQEVSVALRNAKQEYDSRCKNASNDEKDEAYAIFAKQAVNIVHEWSRKHGDVLGKNDELTSSATKLLISFLADEYRDDTMYRQSMYAKLRQDLKMAQGDEFLFSKRKYDIAVAAGMDPTEAAEMWNKHLTALKEAQMKEYKARLALEEAGINDGLDTSVFDSTDFLYDKMVAEDATISKKIYTEIKGKLESPVGEFKNFKEMKAYYEGLISEASSTKQKSKLAEKYNDYVTDLISPYVEEFGGAVFNNAYWDGDNVSNHFSEYIIIPADQYYNGKSPRANYLRNKLGIGWANAKHPEYNENLPSDKEVQENLNKVAKALAKGQVSSAKALVDNALVQLRKGYMHAAPADYDKLIRMRALLSSRSK